MKYKVLNFGVETPKTLLTIKDMATLNGLPSISAYYQFISQYTNIKSTIQAKTLGTNCDTELQNQINSLSSRIKNSGLNLSQLQDFNSKIQPLQNMALGSLRNTFTLDDIGAAL